MPPVPSKIRSETLGDNTNPYYECSWCKHSTTAGRFMKHLLDKHHDDLFDKKNDGLGNPRYTMNNRNSINSAVKTKPVRISTDNETFYCCLACGVGCRKEAMCIRNHFSADKNCGTEHLKACKALMERIKNPESYVPPKRTRTKKESVIATESSPVREVVEKVVEKVIEKVVVKTELDDDQQFELLQMISTGDSTANKAHQQLMTSEYAIDILKKTIQQLSDQLTMEKHVNQTLRSYLNKSCDEESCPRKFNIAEELVLRDEPIQNDIYKGIIQAFDSKVKQKSDEIRYTEKKQNTVQEYLEELHAMGFKDEQLESFADID